MSDLAIERPLPATLPGWRDVRVLLKARIDSLVVVVALAAAAAGTSSPQTLSVLAAACLLASAGASAVNRYLDRHLDTRMERARVRPLPLELSGLYLLVLLVGLVLAAYAQGEMRYGS